MFDAGVIDKKTMRSFDESCLTPIHDFTGEEIRALRECEEVSQTVFAHYLNVTKDYISKRERGEKKPAGPSLKLLSLIERKGFLLTNLFYFSASRRKGAQGALLSQRF